MHKYIRSRCNYLHRTTNHPLAEVTQHPMRPRKNTNSLLWQRKTNRSLDLRIPSNCRTTEPLTKPLLAFASLVVIRCLPALLWGRGRRYGIVKTDRDFPDSFRLVLFLLHMRVVENSRLLIRNVLRGGNHRKKAGCKTRC